MLYSNFLLACIFANCLKVKKILLNVTFIFKITKPCNCFPASFSFCESELYFRSIFNFLEQITFELQFFSKYYLIICKGLLVWHFSNIRSWPSICLFLGPRLLSQTFARVKYNTITLHDSVFQNMESKCNRL